MINIYSTRLKIKSIIVTMLMLALLFSIAAPAIAANDAAPGQLKGDKVSNDIVRVDFVHHVKPVKPSNKNDPGYKLMGVEWPAGTEIDIAVNPTNAGINATDALNTIGIASEVWDTEASTPDLFFGSTLDYTAVYGAYDEKNSIAFGPYSNNGVIAVTSVWYSRKTRTILEFDMLFNTAYRWGDATKDPTVMDLWNIATHEFGHSVGLADVYNSAYNTVTMYGYSNYGDIVKRDLAQPDINGMTAIYGN